jgi:hypothetical protein
MSGEDAAGAACRLTIQRTRLDKASLSPWSPAQGQATMTEVWGLLRRFGAVSSAGAASGPQQQMPNRAG